ncbi:hypothetical protein [Roseimicrobium gellanilyticum]|uniref:hypothetical protein n=1 Tax=Roseimicrobium gellanilyticum TaxID=748857 RepID=UPI0014731DA6|nr:hypothetical protein [Roseimicrobium gellanilyticum]
MELNNKNWDDFVHVRWRVQFLRHMLQMHQTSPKRGTAAWAHEEEDYVQRLEEAEMKLILFPAEWHALPDSNIPS